VGGRGSVMVLVLVQVLELVLVRNRKGDTWVVEEA
jgi:hypothetical protein